MKAFITRFSLLLILGLVGLVSKAATVTVDEIMYELNDETSTATVTGHTDNLVNADIKASISYDGKDYTVTAIGNNAFSYYRDMTSVTIPNTVTTIGQSAFYDCQGLRSSVTIPNSVTTIQKSAFQYCHWITDITLSNSLTAISESAFQNCQSLTKLTIPNSVTDIGANAFSYCEGLTEVTIPNSVTNIGKSAFYRCDNLTEVTITNSVVSIGTGAFSYCKSLKSITVEKDNKNYTDVDGVLYNKDLTTLLQCPGGKTSVTIPNTVTTIDSSSFTSCESLTEVTIPNSVTSIGTSAFSLCSSLKEITIPNSVTKILTGTFSNCSSLTSVTIPNSVTSIGEEAFYNCTSLTEITIPKSVMTISDLALASCTSLQKITVEENNRYYVDIDGVLYNKDVTTLVQCPGGRDSITIPNSVTKLGGWSFAGCDNLTEVIIPDNVTTLGYQVFQFCEHLSSVTIPKSITEIPGRTFYFCKSLPSITIPSSVTTIGQQAFAVCTSLKEVYYSSKNPPEGYSSLLFDYETYDNGTLFVPEDAIAKYKEIIPWKLFKNIVAYDFPDDNVMVEDVHYLLDEESGTASIIGHGKDITKADIPATMVVNGKEYTVTEIGYQAFANCSNLTEVTIPNTVVTIGQQAFYFCDNLTSVIIPSSVKTIGISAFASCRGLKEVIIGDSEPAVNSRGLASASVASTNSGTIIDRQAFFNCTAMTDLTIGNNVTTIGNSSFYSCSNLTEVIIPNSVTSIVNGAFSNCTKLTSVTIPASVTSIGMNAFYDDNALIEVYYAAENPISCQYGIFATATYNNGTLYVPAVAIEKCKETYPWMPFKNIVAYDFPKDVVNATGVNLNLTDVTLSLPTGMIQLEATVLPANCTNDPVVWKSEDSSIATVSDNGFVTAAGAGVTYISATSVNADGTEIQAFCKVTVINNSGIEAAEANEAEVTVSNMTINVSGVADDCSVKVYGVSGGLIAKETGCCSISVASRGVYIVKVGNKVVKVAM